ncbi:paraplegin [Platysternon megacephalum]|uniref:Paraplegin n=1 Tax=Platysternon megacephalum TaxID=55544 RepID=A0A4D9EED2_9SAUR|nr:paraplegin [Platysternon megacephalum]
MPGWPAQRPPTSIALQAISSSVYKHLQGWGGEESCVCSNAPIRHILRCSYATEDGFGKTILEAHFQARVFKGRQEKLGGELAAPLALWCYLSEKCPRMWAWEKRGQDFCH